MQSKFIHAFKLATQCNQSGSVYADEHNSSVTCLFAKDDSTGCILIILLYKTKVADTYVKLQQQDHDLWRNFCFRTTSLWRCKQLMNLCLMSISVCVEGNGLVMFLGFITVDLHLTNRLQVTVDVTQFNHKLTADS